MSSVAIIEYRLYGHIKTSVGEPDPGLFRGRPSQ